MVVARDTVQQSLLVEYLSTRTDPTSLLKRTATGQYTIEWNRPGCIPPHDLHRAAEREDAQVLGKGEFIILHSADLLVIPKTQAPIHVFDYEALVCVPSIPHDSQRAFLQLFYEGTDWTHSSVGHPSTWNTQLKTYVGTLLISPFPVLLQWGPGLSMIYNYSYAAVIGDKHPCLGRSYRDIFSELWEGRMDKEIGDVFKGKGAHNPSTLLWIDSKDGQGNLVRAQETWFKWSSIPVWDPEEKIVRGVYIPNENSTSTMVLNRRLATLSHLGRHTSDSCSYRQYWTRAWESLGCDPTHFDFPKVAIYCARAADTIVDDERGIESPTLRTLHQEERFENLRRRRAASEEDFPAADDDHRLVTPQFASLPEFLFAAGHSGTENTPVSRLLQAAMVELRNGERHIVFDEASTHVLFENERSVWGDRIRSSIFFPIRTANGQSIDAVVLIALHTRMVFDKVYLDFLELVIAQLGAGLAIVKLFAVKLQEAQYRSWIAEQQKKDIRKALEQRSEELRKAESAFQRVADMLPCGLWIADSEGQINYTNDSWHLISGHPRGKPVMEFLDSVAPDERERAANEFAKFWDPTRNGANGTPLEQESGGFIFRWAGETADGHPRWCSNLGCTELDAEGRTVSAMGVIMDISSRKHAELLQKQRADDALVRKKRLNRFIDLLSHELRNPLAAITSCIELMSDRLKDVQGRVNANPVVTAPIDECLDEADTISFCLRHMNRLVNETLTLSKLEHDFQVVSADAFQPEVLVQKVARMYEAELARKGISHSIQLGDGFKGKRDVWIESDYSKVMQIIINYLSNAIKFTHQRPVRTIIISVDLMTTVPILGDTFWSAAEEQTHDGNEFELPVTSPTDAFHLSTVALPSYLLVSVADTGVGLSGQQQKTLFQRFQQAEPKTQTTYGGSGLGLWISRKVASVLGGGCGIQSEAGKGSKFSFYVPVRIVETPGGRPGTLSRASSASAVPTLAGSTSPAHVTTKKLEPMKGGGYTVLLVEDNLINQKLLAKQLIKHGCKVIVADHGGLAIDELLKHSQEIDLCLMDVEMPVVDGLTATKRIRGMEKEGKLSSRLKVLGITANARDQQIQQCLDAGMDGVLTKPFAMLALMARLHSMVPLSES